MVKCTFCPLYGTKEVLALLRLNILYAPMRLCPLEKQG